MGSRQGNSRGRGQVGEAEVGERKGREWAVRKAGAGEQARESRGGERWEGRRWGKQGFGGNSDLCEKQQKGDRQQRGESFRGANGKGVGVSDCLPLPLASPFSVCSPATYPLATCPPASPASAAFHTDPSPGGICPTLQGIAVLGTQLSNMQVPPFPSPHLPCCVSSPHPSLL